LRRRLDDGAKKVKVNAAEKARVNPEKAAEVAEAIRQ
jgi:hypothetical protein